MFILQNSAIVSNLIPLINTQDQILGHQRQRFSGFLMKLKNIWRRLEMEAQG
jgi:hypothetical protein